MKQRCIIIIMFICLMPGVAKAQWTFDILSVEAYINDHKKQRSLLLARSTLEHSNKLLHSGFLLCAKSLSCDTHYTRYCGFVKNNHKMCYAIFYHQKSLRFVPCQLSLKTPGNL